MCSKNNITIFPISTGPGNVSVLPGPKLFRKISDSALLKTLYTYILRPHLHPLHKYEAIYDRDYSFQLASLFETWLMITAGSGLRTLSCRSCWCSRGTIRSSSRLWVGLRTLQSADDWRGFHCDITVWWVRQWLIDPFCTAQNFSSILEIVSVRQRIVIVDKG